MQKQIRIMLVEDSPAYRNTMAMAIKKESDMKLIGQFGTAEEARSFSEVNAPDMILLDLNLPGMAGVEVIPWFEQNLPDVKIIVLTESNQETDVLNAIYAGANGYLLKGSSRRQIFEAIRIVMGGGSTIDPEVATCILKDVQKRSAKIGAESIVSGREAEILKLMADGMAQKQISEYLNISDSTVSTHVDRIYKKLKVNNAPSAVASAIRKGLI